MDPLRDLVAQMHGYTSVTIANYVPSVQGYLPRSTSRSKDDLCVPLQLCSTNLIVQSPGASLNGNAITPGSSSGQLWQCSLARLADSTYCF
jgi:hypothetical protein